MAKPPAETAAIGAYGLRLVGIEGARRVLMDVPGSWPSLELQRISGLATHEQDLFSDERAVIVLRNGGEVVVGRDPLRAVFRVPGELGDEELVHPYLAPVAAVVGRWLGRESLHAGSFCGVGGTWALVGDRESGKSSTLAALARNGHDIVGDDVLVLAGRSAYAGPRLLDLRPDAADRLAAGEAIGVVGARERWRMALGPVHVETTLSGFVFLEWSDAAELIPLSAGERLPRVAAARALLVPPDPRRLLELAAVPGWLLRRPRRWESLPETLRLLESLVNAQPDRRARLPAGE